MQFQVALLGFGNVGQALGELLIRKKDTLLRDFDINLRVVGVCTGSHGQAIDSSGIRLRTAIDAVKYGNSLDGLHQGGPITGIDDFLDNCPADLIFESIPTNPTDGQPALGYARRILRRGMHFVTANKGPVAFGYRELSQLARERQKGFFFESTVMDGAPVLSVGREGLPGAEIRRVRGIFNSTTNYIVTRMEKDGLTFEEALGAAQEIGIAETDPTLDIDGWDSSIKTIILANVLMGADLRPVDVDRTGFRDITLDDVKAAEAEGMRIRLICEVERDEDGEVMARVSPQHVPVGGTMAGITGTTSIVDFETDTLSRLTLVEHNPGPETTAYGMFADMLNIIRGRHLEGASDPKAGG